MKLNPSNQNYLPISKPQQIEQGMIFLLEGEPWETLREPNLSDSVMQNGKEVAINNERRNKWWCRKKSGGDDVLCCFDMRFDNRERHYFRWPEGVPVVKKEEL